MQTIKILFLGAAKRVSLLERFLEAAQRLKCQLEFHSFESTAGFYPISHLAHIEAAPKFTSQEFQEKLSTYIQNHKINIVIPNMDAAAAALSQFREKNAPSDCWCVVSTSKLTQAMYAKDHAQAFFQEQGLNCPANTPGRFPKIAKPILGFGSRGIQKIMTADGLKNIPATSLIEDFIEGAETTADFYMSPKSGFTGAVLRDRIEVSDGEVMVCRTRLPDIQEQELLNKIAAISGWEGCVTVQYIRERATGIPYLIEINPRFGGGATASIEAGLDMAYYILTEFLGQRIEPMQKPRLIMMSRARRDFFIEIPEQRKMA